MILTDKIKKKKKEIWCGGEAENVENFNSASLMVVVVCTCTEDGFL